MKTSKISTGPMFSKMIELIKKAETPQWIICESLLRIARNEEDAATILSLVTEGKIEGIVTPKKTYHREDNIIFLALDIETARRYTEEISRKVKIGLAAKKKLKS